MISFLNSLLLTTALLDALVAGLIYMVFRQDRDRSARVWMWGCLLMASGMGLLTVRQHLPGVVSYGVLNFIMLYALALQGQAFWQLVQPDVKPASGPLLFCVAYGLLQWGLSLANQRQHLSLMASLAWSAMHAYLFWSLRRLQAAKPNAYVQVFQYLMAAGLALWLLRVWVVSEQGIALATDAGTSNLLSLASVHLVLIAQQISYLVVRLTHEKSQKEQMDELRLSLQKAWQDKQTIMEARQDERQQLLRDLHDGFGSKLASLRLLAQKEHVTGTQMAEYLKEIMADLHLFADTLCHEELTLEQALVDMRYRTERQHADGSSPHLHWRVQLHDMPAQEARTALHILRIMQEAMHNAMRHAHARNIWLAVNYSPTQDQLMVSVKDDGLGMPEDVRKGQGLSSMQQRAREIGAHLHWQAQEPGTALVLTLQQLRARHAA